MDATAWKQSVGEPRVLISRRALLHNARVIRKHLSPATRVCAIIKADAYGHGAGIVADTLCNWSDGSLTLANPAAPGADALAVASLDEAAALADGAGESSSPDPQAESVEADQIRSMKLPLSEGPTSSRAPTPIIVFRPVENVFLGRQRAKLEEAVRQRWVLTVCTTTAADDLARIAASCGRRAAVQVMVDSGMTRSGAHPQNVPELLGRIESRPSLRLVGLCTHFASADEPDNQFTAEQLSRFLMAIDNIKGVGPAAMANIVRHAASSGAIFALPSSHLDMVRPGISLYGIDPMGKPNLQRPLRPVMKWTAPLVGVKEIAPGVTVGYGQTWRALRRSRIGLLPVGYADGYCRSFSNRAVVMVHNRAAPVIGRVSMDLTTIDLSDIPQAIVGDEAILLDNDPLSPASVYKLAEWSNTVPYEVFCRIGPRVRRVGYDPEDDSPRLPEKNSRIAPDLG
jgi:alanine racemase